jgi:type VI secretion system protein ImpG
MPDTLYPYYERELHFIREFSKDFAKRYPAAAGRLLQDETRSADPHVERLIESFALLAGRIHHKLDDDFPELTDALLGVLYPHYLAPIPSLAIVEMELDVKQAQIPKGLTIPRHSRLQAQAIGDVRCQFRTCYPVTLWPLRVVSANLTPPPLPAMYRPPANAAGALTIELECVGGVTFADLTLDKLRFHLAGEDAYANSLYEQIFNHTIGVMFRPLDGGGAATGIMLEPETCLSDVGFGPNEGLLPYPEQAFAGYRLLTEFFAFPSKFLFFDLGGFRQVAAAKFKRRLEVVLFFDRWVSGLDQAVSASMFRLHCAPAINLFPQLAEPILSRGTDFEYRIVPDAAHPRGMEVYSVDDVTSMDNVTGVATSYRPFFSYRHGEGMPSEFWYASRRPSGVDRDAGTEVFLSLVDLNFKPKLPPDTVISAHVTCSNRDLPAQIQLSGQKLNFELGIAAPLARISCVRPATPSLRPSGRRAAFWRLISHLSLNHLSLAASADGIAALKEILRLYDFSDPESGGQFRAVNRQLIDGITAVSSRRVVGQVGSPTSSGFCRGVEITVEFDAASYVGTGVFLFAAVLERFFGLYASLNSFSQLVAKVKQEEGTLKRWPPRAGLEVLL